MFGAISMSRRGLHFLNTKVKKNYRETPALKRSFTLSGFIDSYWSGFMEEIFNLKLSSAKAQARQYL